MKKDEKTTNIFLSGVGGQGAILASNILGEVFIRAGYDVRKRRFMAWPRGAGM
jgi:indolepyruvate ferredoxin oxidoreductase beta subunit